MVFSKSDLTNQVMTRSDLIVSLLTHKYSTFKLGLIIKGIDSVNPSEVIADLLSKHQGEHFYFSIVGYDGVEPCEEDRFTITTKIEKAVWWRSRPEYAGHIYVFVKDETEKLHSLSDFDEITSLSVGLELLRIQQEGSQNEAERRFWAGLSKISNTVSLPLLEDFVARVSEHSATKKDNCGIPNNLWCLNLLNDPKILDISSKTDYIESRLAKNRELIVQMSYLSDDFRKKMSAALARTVDAEEKSRLRKIYHLLQDYFKFGDSKILQSLTYDDVLDLFTVSKKAAQSKPVDPDDVVLPVNNKVKEIKGKELNDLIGDTLIDADPESLEEWSNIVEKIKENISSGDTTSFNDDLSHNGRPISFKLPKSELRQLIGQVCNENTWGAVVTTQESVLKSAIYNEDNETHLLRPSEVNNDYTSYSDASLFSLMRRYDDEFKKKSLGDPDDTFGDLIDKLCELRGKLVENMDFILSSPVLYFGLVKEGRDTLINYVDTWTELYLLFDRRFDTMRKLGDTTTTHIAQVLMRLDILYFKTPTEYKAILLPLHPVYLWRYYEVAKLITNPDSITEEEKSSLKEVVNSLPQVLNFVVVDKNITDGKAAVLPCSGNIEMLPTFENKTNRYLGVNGIESVKEVLSRWSLYAPYSKNEIRICTVDAPDHLAVLHMISDHLEQQGNGRVVYNIYLTKGQNVNTELSHLDFAGGGDSVVGELIRDNRIILGIKNLNSSGEVLDELVKNPVHVAFYFDQSSFTVDYGQRQNLYINPLVVTYNYDYDSIGHHGRLYPSMESDSGLVGGYHKMLSLSGLTSPNLEPHVNSYSNTDTSNIVSALEKGLAQWLVVGDRSTSNYTPKDSIPIGEKQYDKRTVNIWARKDTRIIKDYERLLRKYNISPKTDVLVEILSKYGHISSTGLISIPKFGADVKAIETRKKGLIGTLFSASWYNKHHEDSVVVSLDTQNARCWLFSGNKDVSDERADLLGLWFDSENNTLHINPLEVKTHDESIEAVITKHDKQSFIQGHAADQVAKVVSLINEIFGLTKQTSLEMFVSARREVLKYQIVSECFRNIHDPEWQKRWEGILKGAFRPAEDRSIKVNVSGILLHIKLSAANGTGSESCYYDGEEQYPIEFVQLAAKDIQKEIFGDSLADLTAKAQEQYLTEEDETKPSESSSEPDTTAVATEQVIDDNADSSTPADTPAEEEDRVQSRVQYFEADEDIKQLVKSFKRACSSFHVRVAECSPENAVVGPGLVRLRFRLEQGQSLSNMTSRLDDIGREMQRTGILVRTIMNSGELNLDIPRLHRDKVLYKDVESSIPAGDSLEQLYFALGKTPEGKDIILDLASIPHLLVGGSTGSGKTVFLYTLLIALLQSHPQKDDIILILSSSKREDFVYFEKLPQLFSGRVIAEAREATDLIKGFVAQESARRGDLLADAWARDIIEYNKKNTEKLPPIVVVIDEFADLADQLSSKKEREEFYTQVQRIAQTGRSRGIHLVVCTQRPEAKLVPPTTKAQLNGRVALRVNDPISSSMIIGAPDAKNLQKHGDLLYKNGDTFERAQGYYIDTDELVERIRKILAAQ